MENDGRAGSKSVVESEQQVACCYRLPRQCHSLGRRHRRGTTTQSEFRALSKVRRLSLSWTPDGRWLIVTFSGSRLFSWDSTGKNELPQSKLDEYPVLASTRPIADVSIKSPNAAGGQRPIIPERSKVQNDSFSPDGHWLVKTYTDEVEVWDSEKENKRITLIAHGSSTDWSPDSRWFVVTSDDRRIQVWDSSREIDPVVIQCSGSCEHYNVIFDSETIGVLVKGEDGKVQHWNPVRKEELVPLDLDLSKTYWSPSGHRFAMTDNNTVHVWDAARYQELFTLETEENEEGLIWSEDGKRLAFGKNVFAMDIELLMSVARRRITRNLILEECSKYLHTTEIPAVP
jgi:WD40 repeat protein